jgi:hypothetical protein
MNNKINKSNQSFKYLSMSLIVFFCLLFTGVSVAIEEPDFTLIKKDKPFELRAYAPMIIAEVEVAGDMKQASNRGFRLIADYIFGNNTATDGDSSKISMTAPVTMEAQSEKISMTAPVTMEQNNGSDSWRVHFVMPSEYNMVTLPKPNNSQVNIRELAPQNYAVIRFSGFTGEQKVAKKTQELLDWMQAEGLEPKGSPELARYNAPITPPFFRRNEVMVAY